MDKEKENKVELTEEEVLEEAEATMDGGANEADDAKEAEATMDGGANEADDAKKAETEVVEETLEEKLQKELEEEKAKSAGYLDRLQRLMAEFDNYRKRTEKEKLDTYDNAVSNTVAEFLPMLDNFERALKVESSDKVLYQGLDMVYKQTIGILENLKVKPIEAVGKEFDPNLHNAIMHIDDEELGENIIAEEVQKGYTYKEKVMRYSLVKVAN